MKNWPLETEVKAESALCARSIMFVVFRFRAFLRFVCKCISPNMLYIGLNR